MILFKIKNLKFKIIKRLLIVLFALLIIGAPLLYLTVLNSKTTSASWFNENWNYRKRIDITNSSGSTQTDYQISITFDSTGLVSSGKLLNTCADLRATDSNSKALSYWIEPTTCNTSTTKVWVKVSSIPTTGATIYLYYGNPTATSLSSTTNTFIREITNVQGAWTLDESSGGTGAVTRNDTSGNNNNLTDNNTVPSGTGNFSNGASFTPANSEYLSITNASQTGLSLGSNFSLEAWINPGLFSACDGGICGIISKWQNNGAFSYRFFTGDDGVGTGYIAFAITSNGWAGGGFQIGTTAGFINTSTWTHLVLTSDGTTIRLYKNGAEVTNQDFPYTGNGTPPTTTDPFAIGASGNGSPGNFFNGIIDESRVYNKTLSTAEVSDLYNNYGYSTTNYVNKILVRKRAATEPAVGTPQNEESGPGKPRLYWKFDEGQGTAANDSSGQNNTGTLAGTTKPTWQAEGLCVSGKCLYFDGATSNVGIGTTVTNVQSVGFWVKPKTNGEPMVDLDGGTHTITASSGTISANGFSSPTIYVNGKVSSTLTANTWNYIEVTTNTAFTSTNLKVSTDGTTYLNGFIDEFKVYDYARTAAQVKTDYASRGSIKGVSAQIGGADQNYLSNGLVGYWKMDETSGNAADSSGNGVTLTNNGTTTFAAGKFSNASSYNGSSQYLNTATAINGIKTISFWAYTPDTTNYFINLINSSAYITSSTGTFSATGFTSPSIYVNGVLNGTISANTWSHVVITANTAINANAFAVGLTNDGTNHFYTNTSKIDEVRIYNRALSPKEVSDLYNWAPGPVGYWNMDEGTGTTAYDISGNALAADFNAGTPIWTSGKYGKGISLTTADRLRTASTSNLLFNRNFTIEAWVNPPSSVVMGQILYNGGSNWYLALSFNGIQFGDQGVENVFNGNSIIPANKWSHIAVTVDGNNTANVKAYINGVLDQQGTTTATFNDGGASTLTFGETSFFQGKLDEVKVYNYARTQKQIVSDMLGSRSLGIGSNVSQSSPVAYWDMDDGQGTIAHDLTPNRNDLTLSSASWTNSGKFGKAWNGTGALWLSRTDDADLDFAAADDFSYSLWFKSDSATNPGTGTSEYLVQKVSTSGYSIYANDAGKIVFSDTDGTNIDTVTSSSDIYDGTWHHILAEKTGTSRIDLYVDGKLDASNTSLTNTSTLANAGTLYLGDKDGINNGDEFNGDLDEVKVYRYALTSDEIRTDYNRGSSLILGAAGNSSTYQAQAANQEYCVPGDPSACSGPVAEWKFEEGIDTSANDTSGNGNTTAWSGTGNHWIPGKYGKGGNFNGSDDYLTSNAAAINTSNPYTLEAWIWPLDDNACHCNGDRTIAGNIWGDKLVVNGATGASQQLAIAGVTSSTGSLTIGTWQHVAVTYNGPNTYTFYVNGKNVTSTSTGTGTNDSSVILIGSQNGPSGQFNGKIDEVKIYNYARTPAQIAWDYNRGKPVAYWDFDECQGGSVYDLSGNNNTGTITIGTGVGSTQDAVGTCTTNAATAWYNGRTGKFNSSLNLDGIDDYITTAAFSPLATATQTTSNFSWGGWFYPISSASKTLMEKVTEFRITTDASSNAVCGIYYTGAFNDASSVTAALTSSAWNHVLCTYDGTNLKTYINGILKNTTAYSTAVTAASSILHLGQNSSLDQRYGGQIDDVKIFNYPLTATQIKGLYNNGAVFFGPLTGSP